MVKVEESKVQSCPFLYDIGDTFASMCGNQCVLSSYANRMYQSNAPMEAANQIA